MCVVLLSDFLLDQSPQRLFWSHLSTMILILRDADWSKRTVIGSLSTSQVMGNQAILFFLLCESLWHYTLFCYYSVQLMISMQKKTWFHYYMNSPSVTFFFSHILPKIRVKAISQICSEEPDWQIVKVIQERYQDNGENDDMRYKYLPYHMRQALETLSHTKLFLSPYIFLP